ncbi:hypothetical protein J3Q64DRAFT_1718865 [Phycomyces blakesleeanus]|uniref:PHD-type domain-containing protein n=2 Tax=Phycomyces blakesleeanus TaxID=4837 RepID=A0A162Y6S1_PHYB8|nr:hypothetical protein PHYBLDRAFT_185275 [Phycomyces blakesleeanus NRRL 1555(-)]OAD78625.1 hypothetical protein PHYBLDRAFT_185275 [Phycomyces blakesleeanus NRRL 1555(-)]|eukprot:XP_018296665.1 hypothetical protein PHYBLDRAFT_185275 [Phycomyces blakesleeanus NRRL 1555(-)]
MESVNPVSIVTHPKPSLPKKLSELGSVKRTTTVNHRKRQKSPTVGSVGSISLKNTASIIQPKTDLDHSMPMTLQARLKVEIGSEDEDPFAHLRSNLNQRNLNISKENSRDGDTHLSDIQTVNQNISKDRVQASRPRTTFGGKLPVTSNYNQHHQPAPSSRRQKRLSAEQLKLLSRRIDPAAPLASPHDSPTKPALPSLHSHTRKRAGMSILADFQAEEKQSSLFKTCSTLWKGEPHLGDFSHDSIKSFGELLKVRLTQAKFRVMGADTVNPLTEQHQSGWFSPFPIKLSSKRSQSCSLSVVGNGRRLFGTRNTGRKKRTGFRMADVLDRRRATPCMKITNTSLLTSNPEKVPKDRKTRTPKLIKKKLCTTPKRRTPAVNVSPVIVEDGTRKFVCEPCNKRYKNRNGLTYHLDRCKSRSAILVKQEIEEEKNAIIMCICDNAKEDRGMMIQCDQCRVWLHMDCTGLNEGALDDIYSCPRCANSADTPLTIVPEPDLLENIIYRNPGRDLLQKLENVTGPEESKQEQPDPSKDFIEMFNLFGDELVQDPMVEAALKDDHDDVWGHFEDDNLEYEKESQVAWDDFLFSPHQTLGNSIPEPWSQLSEDEPITTYGSALVDTPWDMHQTPSLLFSDNTFSSALDEEFMTSTPMADISSPLDHCMPMEFSSPADLPTIL